MKAFASVPSLLFLAVAATASLAGGFDVDPHALVWTNCGACPQAPEVIANGANVTVGIAGRPEQGYAQNVSKHIASALLPAASAYTVTISYNLSTWDSYNKPGIANPPFNGGTGFYDSFSVSTSTTPYWNLALADPLTITPSMDIGFLWGGSSFGDGNVETINHTMTVVLKGDPSKPNYLNVGLDTATAPADDSSYPSWGSFTILSIDATPPTSDIPIITVVPAFYQCGNPYQTSGPYSFWWQTQYDTDFIRDANGKVILGSDSKPTPASICKEGCAMTSLAMVLSYHGYPYTPATLNDKLNSLGAYGYVQADNSTHGDVVWPAVSQNITPNKFEPRPLDPDDAVLDAELSLQRPVILHVYDYYIGGGHYVVAIGKTAGVYDIIDPGHIAIHKLSDLDPNGAQRYHNRYTSMMRIDPAGSGSFVVYANPGTEILVTDPLGRRVGYFNGSIINEIPQAWYGTEDIKDDDPGSGPDASIPPHRVAFISFPPQGNYNLTITRNAGGIAEVQVYRYNLQNVPQTIQTLAFDLVPGQAATQPTTYSTRLGDVNGDGYVNAADLAIVKASFGKRLGQLGYNPAADVNGDGIVDIRDLAIVGRFDPPPQPVHVPHR